MSLNGQYLESKVLTAPAYRLHLMLIEGAIRYGRQAEAALGRGDAAAASGPMMRMLDVVGELLAGVRESKTELNKQIADFYLYLFRVVSAAKVNDDAAKVGEALELLEYERQTWQLVCDKMEQGAGAAAGSLPTTGQSQHRPRIAPPLGGTSPLSASGLSLEA